MEIENADDAGEFVREILNEVDFEFVHGDRTTKCQFGCLSFILNIFYFIFIFHFCMDESW